MKKVSLIIALSFAFLSSKAQTYTASFDTRIDGIDLSLKVDVNKTSGKATITQSGPSAAYFSFGFGSSVMLNTYSLLCNSPSGPIEERKLGAIDEGALLTPSTTLVSSTTSGGIMTVVVTRNLAGPNADYYDFSNITEGTNLPIIYAKGFIKNLIDHSTLGRGATTLTFSLLTATDNKAEIKNNISLYPNPTSEGITIDLDKTAKTTTIKILTTNYVTVKTVVVENDSHFNISLADLASGAYFVSLKNDDYQFLEKIIKE